MSDRIATTRRIAPTRRIAAAALVMMALVTMACASESSVSQSAPPVTEAEQERVAFVALGGDETVNRQLEDPLRDAWPQLVFTGALPRSAVYVNFARPEATVRSGLVDQVPAAVELDPSVAAVWFGTADAQEDTDESSFQRDLRSVVDALQGAGARVLLLTPRPSENDAGRFSDVVRGVGDATGSTVVVVPDGDVRRSSTQSAIADAVAGALDR